MNFGKTSAPLGVQGSTLASADLFLGDYSLNDGRLAMSDHILFDIGSGIAKAITYQFLQVPLPAQLWQVSSSQHQAQPELLEKPAPIFNQNVRALTAGQAQN